jgi:multidrug efflux pump
MRAALKGAAQIGFTIVSLTISLIAVLIPLLFMGDIVGRLFREFAVTLAVTILVSAVVSLTLTPMMCSRLLKHTPEANQTRLFRVTEGAWNSVLKLYDRTLKVVLRHQFTTLVVAISTLVLTIYLYVVIPKGFFPIQDTGVIQGISEAAQTVSFPQMSSQQQQLAKIILKDPAVESLSSFIGIDGTNTTMNSGRILINLKPLDRRELSASDVIRRLQPKLAGVAGITLFMQPVQDISVEDRVSRTQFQYTLEDPSADELNVYGPQMLERLQREPALRDVASDQQVQGLQARLVFDRITASRLGITPASIDQALYDSYGQRQISTIFTQLNQYHVVLEVKQAFRTTPEDLRELFIRTGMGSSGSSGLVSGGGAATQVFGASSASAAALNANISTTGGTSGSIASSAVFGATPGSASVFQNGGQVPLAAFTHLETRTVPIAVNHQGQFPVVTLSFNLAPGSSLGDAVRAVNRVKQEIGMPPSVQGDFQGTAEAFQTSLVNEPILILAALITVYIVLGVLYESYIHPITILSTLPSAGVGALLALILCRNDFSVIALIGIVLLIGIVKKNAIMMIDFALDAERKEGLAAIDAIYQACLLRFRPIMMTTMAALLGGVPLALGTGTGSELRRPLGITIVGGLILSQLLTLYTTPVIYLYFDRLARRLSRGRASAPGAEPVPAE